MSDKLSFEEQEKQRLDQIENEAERNSSRVKGADILAELDIQDEYFDEPEKCSYCQCVCMGDKRCIQCSGKCTCNERGSDEIT